MYEPVFRYLMDYFHCWLHPLEILQRRTASTFCSSMKISDYSLSKMFQNFSNRWSENWKHQKNYSNAVKKVEKVISLHRPTAWKRALSVYFSYSPSTKGVGKIHLFVRRLAWKVQTNGENDYYLKSLSLAASFLVSLKALEKKLFSLVYTSATIRRGDFSLKGWGGKS